MQEIWVYSSVDGTKQPSLFFETCEDNCPLLVGLHTWGGDRFNQEKQMLPLARKMGWNLLLPEFRGPNSKDNPNCIDACGSNKAKQDIIDAVDYVKQNYKIDENNIFLLGASGGGHMSLLMAAYAPNLWRAVGAFVPVVDLKKWHEENPNYREKIEACCGGIPTIENEIEYTLRSPISYVSEIAKANLKIFSGKWDKIIPCHHGLDIYNSIFTSHPQAKVFFEMFDGGHEMPIKKAEEWLVSQLTETEKTSEQVTG